MSIILSNMILDQIKDEKELWISLNQTLWIAMININWTAQSIQIIPNEKSTLRTTDQG